MRVDGHLAHDGCFLVGFSSKNDGRSLDFSSRLFLADIFVKISQSLSYNDLYAIGHTDQDAPDVPLCFQIPEFEIQMASYKFLISCIFQDQN